MPLLREAPSNVIDNVLFPLVELSDQHVTLLLMLLLQVCRHGAQLLPAHRQASEGLVLRAGRRSQAHLLPIRGATHNWVADHAQM